MKPLTKEEMKQIIGGYGTVCVCDSSYNCICGSSGSCSKSADGRCLICGNSAPACLGNK